MSLSSLIVQREIATIRQVEEALARQVLYGGDLATNLLEVAPVEEWRIAVTFADAFALPAAPPGPVPIAPPETLALVPVEIATRLGIVPVSGDATNLIVAAAEPLKPDEITELEAAHGIHIEVRIALAVRIREALAQGYGVPLDRRIERLLVKLSKNVDAREPTKTSEPPGRSPSVPPFKLSPAYGIPAARSPLAPENRDETPASAEARAEGPEIIPSVPPIPLVSPALPSAPPSRPGGSLRRTQHGFPAPAANDPLDQTPAPPVNVPPPVRQTGQYAETKPTFVKATSNAVRPARRHRGPLTMAAAEEELEHAEDRDALLDLLFEFARQFFDYAALFIAHGDIAEGRDAFGDGATRERVVGIGVPLDMPSMLQTAREKKEAVVLRPQEKGLDGVLLSDLKRPATVEALVMPVLVRDRAVAILYADAGGTLDRSAVSEVIAFGKSIGQGFERIIVRRKLAGFSSGAPASSVGKVDASSLPLPEKASPSTPPAEKAVRAAALGRALFTGGAQSDRPGAFTQPAAAAPVVVLQQAPTPAPPAVDRRHPSSRPPPANIVAVRATSGPPIPREEPDSAPEIEETSEVESEALDDDAAQALLAEIGESMEPIAEDGHEVLIELHEPAPMAPESEQAVAIGPHRPPTAHNEKNLPSIIVDIAGELSALVERVLAGTDDGMAEGELLRQGASAMPAIMARFPGPLARSRSDMQEPLPRPSDCGPLLRLIARQRKVALAYVLEEVASADVSRRFWATFLLSELPYAEGARLLVPRLFDPDPKVRLVARSAARAMAEAAHDALLNEIGRIVREPSTSRTARLGLLEALGDMREGKAVAMLIGHLSDEDAELATVTRRALIAITRQDMGLDTRKWLAWWGQNSGRHRIEWLIDALVDETQGIRRAAGEELKTLTHETFGYYDDLPKRERERAQQRFRDWWASEGRARFVRS